MLGLVRFGYICIGLFMFGLIRLDWDRFCYVWLDLVSFVLVQFLHPPHFMMAQLMTVGIIMVKYCFMTIFIEYIFEINVKQMKM